MAKARDQSHMYPGSTGVSPSSTKTSRQLAKDRNERLAKKAEERRQVKPEADKLTVLINMEIIKIKNGVYPDEDKMTDRQYHIERRARRLAVAHLESIKTKLGNMLREAPKPKNVKPEPSDWTAEVDSELER